MGWSTTVIVPPDGDMEDYILSLEKLLHRKEEYYLPTHGKMIKNPLDLVKKYITHRLERENQIKKAIKSHHHIYIAVFNWITLNSFPARIP